MCVKRFWNKTDFSWSNRHSCLSCIKSPLFGRTMKAFWKFCVGLFAGIIKIWGKTDADYLINFLCHVWCIDHTVQIFLPSIALNSGGQLELYNAVNMNSRVQGGSLASSFTLGVLVSVLSQQSDSHWSEHVYIRT